MSAGCSGTRTEVTDLGYNDDPVPAVAVSTVAALAERGSFPAPGPRSPTSATTTSLGYNGALSSGNNARTGSGILVGPGRGSSTLQARPTEHGRPTVAVYSDQYRVYSVRKQTLPVAST